MATHAPLCIPSTWEQGLLPGSNDLADKLAGLGGRVGWYKEAPEARTLPAGSLDISALKQAELGGSKDLADENELILCR